MGAAAAATTTTGEIMTMGTLETMARTEIMEEEGGGGKRREEGKRKLQQKLRKYRIGDKESRERVGTNLHGFKRILHPFPCGGCFGP